MSGDLTAKVNYIVTEDIVKLIYAQVISYNVKGSFSQYIYIYIYIYICMYIYVLRDNRRWFSFQYLKGIFVTHYYVTGNKNCVLFEARITKQCIKINVYYMQ